MNTLQIQVPAALRHVVGVADLIPKLRSATAYFTSFCHKTDFHRAQDELDRPPIYHKNALVFETGWEVNLSRKEDLTLRIVNRIHRNRLSVNGFTAGESFPQCPDKGTGCSRKLHRTGRNALATGNPGH